MMDLTLGNAIAAIVPIGGAFWLILQNIAAGKDKHRVTTQAELDKQKAAIDADFRKDELRIAADVEKEKVKQLAEVEKIREKGMGGEAVVKIWQVVDHIKDDVAKLEENQAKDHSDNLLRNEIVTRLHGEVANFTKLLFENLITRR